MSEIKTNEPVKQEGDFSLKGKSKKPKQLSKQSNEITKVSIKEPLIDLEPDVTKVVIPKRRIKTRNKCHSRAKRRERRVTYRTTQSGIARSGTGKPRVH